MEIRLKNLRFTKRDDETGEITSYRDMTRIEARVFVDILEEAGEMEAKTKVSSWVREVTHNSFDSVTYDTDYSGRELSTTPSNIQRRDRRL
jgi:hypothetical protein